MNTNKHSLLIVRAVILAVCGSNGRNNDFLTYANATCLLEAYAN